MSDMTIPGVNSGLNTDKIVSKLMELERIPLNRKENELETYEQEKTIWQDLSRNITKMQVAARSLYGAENPFNARVVESSDERVLTATANRGALEQEKEITVLKKASSDRFLSDSIDKDFDVPSGTYSFSVGDEEISFSFRGGNISRLADRINSRGNDLIRAQVIKDSPGTSVFLIESTKPGLENKLGFSEGKALEFAVAAGILNRTDSSSRVITPSPPPKSEGTEQLDNGKLLLTPGANGTFSLIPPVKDNGNLLLELTVQINNMAEGEWSAPSPPPGPDNPEPGSVSYKGVSIENTESRIELPSWEEPEPPEKTVDLEVFSSLSEAGVHMLPALKDTESEQKIRVKLSDLGGTTKGIAFENRNTYKEITLSEIRIYDPNARGDWKPARAIEQASNSKMLVDGVEITRNDNTVEDLVPGVTLNIRGESEDPVIINISPDRNLIKDRIIGFVGNYNRLQAELSILSSNDSSVVSEIDYFTEDERETALERLGRFQGDSTLIQMKSKFQMMMMEPYPNPESDTTRLLSQIGISTNSTGFGGGVNNSKLRGYIEINEEELDSALEENIGAVKALFGHDSNGDLIVDSGAAYKAQEYSSPYTGSAGIISYRISSLDSRITRTERDITNYTQKLEDKEADLKNKYANMEGNINSMQQSSNALNNLNNNNN